MASALRPPSEGTGRRFIDRIFDPFRERRPPPRKKLGTSGATVYGGQLQETERNPKLRGTERYRTFSDLLANISIVAAGTRYFLNLASKPTWKWEPKDTARSVSNAQRIADAVKRATDAMETPWHRVVRRAAMYRFHGFSVQEWTAKRLPEGFVGFLDIEPRPQVTIERWDLDLAGTVFGVTQRRPQDNQEIYLPRSKLVYIVDDTLSDMPTGVGLFRHLAEPALRLQRYQQLEQAGFYSDLHGVPLGRAPFMLLHQLQEQGRVSDEDVKKIMSTLEEFIRKHIKNPDGTEQVGLVLDSAPYASTDGANTPSSQKQFDLELLQAENGATMDAMHTAIERLNREIARVLGVEGLLLGESERGSMALSRDKSHTFGLIVDSTMQELAESFEKDAVGALATLNGWDEQDLPTATVEAVRYRDIEQITGALRDMAQAGAILEPDDPAIAEIRDLLGLSKPDFERMLREASLNAPVRVRPGETDDAARGAAGGAREEEDEPTPTDPRPEDM